MELVTPSMIAEIDSYAINTLGIEEYELMKRSGYAIRAAAEEILPNGGKVSVLCGKGNNGGDGYAFSYIAFDKFDITVYDVFDGGQRSEAGKKFLSDFLGRGGKVQKGMPNSDALKDTDLIVDAILGTGASFYLCEELSTLADTINNSGKKVLAVDIPLGVDGELGRVAEGAVKADLTVALSFVKVGTVSYPAREFMGKILCDSLSLPKDRLSSKFSFKNIIFDKNEAIKALPKRKSNTNKGSFGKALLITGSEVYEGAGRLSLEAALRGGAGIVTFLCAKELRDRIIPTYPEAIYAPILDDPLTALDEIIDLSKKHSAVLIGSGSGTSEKVYLLVKSLLSTKGGPLVIDADGINSIAKFGDKTILKSARRQIILTPHPLEFSRLSGIPTEKINAERLGLAKEFAREYGVILLLKGAATIVTDGDLTYINSTGNTALAKGGSGDTLAGLITSLSAFSESPLSTVALSAYIHGEAADRLSEELSSFGVIPSDLPKEMAKVIANLEKNAENVN